MGLTSANILGVKVTGTRETKVLRQIRLHLQKYPKKSLGKIFITTPNPEHVMMAQTDLKYRKILNSSDIAVADGNGLVAAYKFLSLPKGKNPWLRPFLYFAQGLGVGFSVLFDRDFLTEDLQVIHGRKLFMDLVKLANKKGWKVFLLGDRKNSAGKAKAVLESNYMGLELFAHEGPDLELNGTTRTEKDKQIEENAVKTINTIKPHILFVGFGAPKQEKWVYRWKKSLNAGCIMVVGGTFDYISGEKKSPPKWLSDIGLEWLWRLLAGDQKLKRVMRAFPEFPLAVYRSKLNQ